VTGDSTFAFRRAGAEGQVLAIIALGALLRFVLASTVGLGVDESYAVAVARQFSPSYFDHPPLHFWLAGGIARLAGTEVPEVVRLPFVLCFAGTTWFVFCIGRRLFGDRAGLFAALLLNVSAVFSLSAGGWVLPDGPLMLCTTAAVDRIAAILFGDVARGERGGAPATATGSVTETRSGRNWRVGAWCLAGLLTGLAMLAKYHGVFVLAGTAAFLATSRPHRKWLATPGPYLGTLLALVCFTPVISWNAAHGWASFAFQGARAAPGAGVHLDTFVANIGGQMAWVLPWVFIPLAAAAWRALRAGPRDAERWFLLSIAAGPIAVFTLVSLRGDVGLPHWEAPGWLFVFPMLGAAVAERLAAGARGTRRWVHWSAWGYLALVLLLASHASTGWLARVWPSAFERGDPSGDLVTWADLPGELAKAGFDPARDFIAATSWIQAGKASVAAGPSVVVLCLCADPHHFYYLHDDREYLGRDAVIVHKKRAGDDVPSRFAPYFTAITAAGEFPVMRGAQEVMRVELFRATGFRQTYPTDQPR
jgi:4-amino-4-deoxy-L-arabinose transferase-like glycosyltransferase